MNPYAKTPYRNNQMIKIACTQRRPSIGFVIRIERHGPGCRRSVRTENVIIPYSSTKPSPVLVLVLNGLFVYLVFFYNVKFYSKGYGPYVDCSRSDRFAIYSINIRNHVRRPSSFVNEMLKERVRITRTEQINAQYNRRRLKN